MPEERYDKKRDCRFDDWRRNNIEKGGIRINLPLYSTDLDCVEYIYKNNEPQPVAMIEKKSEQSGWRGKMNGGITACWKLAQAANIPFYVSVHNTVRSHWVVHLIDTPKMSSENIILDGTLYNYFMFICDLHGVTIADNMKEKIKLVIAIDENGESVYEEPQ